MQDQHWNNQMKKKIRQSSSLFIWDVIKYPAKMASMTLKVLSALAHRDRKPQAPVFSAVILCGKKNTSENLFRKATIVKYFSIVIFLQFISHLQKYCNEIYSIWLTCRSKFHKGELLKAMWKTIPSQKFIST